MGLEIVSLRALSRHSKNMGVFAGWVYFLPLPTFLSRIFSMPLRGNITRSIKVRITPFVIGPMFQPPMSIWGTMVTIS